MSDSISYTAVMGRVKEDIDYIAEQAYKRGKKDAERKRGEWTIEHVPYMVGSKNLVEVIICSNCRYVLQHFPSNFCPNCGADMRGEKDEVD